MHIEYHYLSKAIGNGICSLFFLMMSLIGETMGYFQFGPGMVKIDKASQPQEFHAAKMMLIMIFLGLSAYSVASLLKALKF